MILTSPSFEHDSSIPRKFTCDGGGINPEFQVQYFSGKRKKLGAYRA